MENQTNETRKTKPLGVADVLGNIDSGELVMVLGQELKKTAQELQTRAPKSKATITVTLTLQTTNDTRELDISGAVKTSLPARVAGDSRFFTDNNGGMARRPFDNFELDGVDG